MLAQSVAAGKFAHASRQARRARVGATHAFCRGTCGRGCVVHRKESFSCSSQRAVQSAATFTTDKSITGIDERDQQSNGIMLKVAANGQRLFLPGAVAQDVVFEGAPFAKFARPSDLKEALVLGFASDNATNLSDIKLGKVSCTRWMACARKKLWWMIPEWGTNMSDVPTETQFMLLEHGSGGPYTVLLPLIDGPFRATLKADRNKCALTCFSCSQQCANTFQHEYLLRQAQLAPSRTFLTNTLSCLSN